MIAGFITNSNRSARGFFCLLISLFCLNIMGTGCTPRLAPAPEWQGAAWVQEAKFIGNHVRMADGAELPLHQWLPTDFDAADNSAPRPPLKAIIIGIHGFNDYGGAFAHLGPEWAKQNIGLYSYDQRGFGGAPYRGYWHGHTKLIEDLVQVTHAIHKRHPNTPLYLLGLSMGGAVTLTSLAQYPDLPIEGAILGAPAVWGRAHMPFYQTWALWLGAHSFPWLTLSGRGLKIKPSDNRKMLIKMARDPKTIKTTRIDAIWGLVNLMDRALESASGQTKPLLFLYGQKDDLVPKAPTIAFLQDLPSNLSVDLAVYEKGYHMLLRDLSASEVQQDIFAWIARKPLSASATKDALKRLQENVK